MARDLHPGQRNSLDALCRRYEVDNSQREVHGALLDAELLAEVYLAMTGGQAALLLDESTSNAAGQVQAAGPRRIAADRPPLAVIRADERELAAHRERLEAIRKAAGGSCVWDKKM